MPRANEVHFELARSQSRARGMQWIVRKHWPEISDKGGKTATEFKKTVVSRCLIKGDGIALLAKAKKDYAASLKPKKKK